MLNLPDNKRPNPVGGLLAGAAGGLLAAWIMNQFQTAWSKASESLHAGQENTQDEHPVTGFPMIQGLNRENPLRLFHTVKIGNVECIRRLPTPFEALFRVVISPFLAVCQFANRSLRLARFQRSLCRLHPEVLPDFSRFDRAKQKADLTG